MSQTTNDVYVSDRHLHFMGRVWIYCPKVGGGRDVTIYEEQPKSANHTDRFLKSQLLPPAAWRGPTLPPPAYIYITRIGGQVLTICRSSSEISRIQSALRIKLSTSGTSRYEVHLPLPH